MRIIASGHHTNSQETNKKSSFGTLSLGNAFIATINHELH